MSVESPYDLVVIGAGPGGYVAAIRASQLGMKVACVDKRKALGGTCLNIGCIPSKALLTSSELYAKTQKDLRDHGIIVSGVSLDFGQFMERKEKVVKQLTSGIAHLFKKNKITSYSGSAKVNREKNVEVETKEGATRLQAKHILIATGSEPIPLSNIPFDGKTIIDSTSALSLPSIPKEMIVIGGGYIGLEMGSVYSRLGTKVTVVEAMERIIPAMDLELSQALEKALKKQGLNFYLQTTISQFVMSGERGEIVARNSGGKEETLSADVILVAVGRRANTTGLGLDEAGIEKDEKGRIVVGENFETSVSGIYAVGDVIAGPMLAHKASEEGVACVEGMMGQKSSVNYDVVPGVVYTQPEVASVGMTEEEARKKSVPIKTFKFPFIANGRAIASGEKEGFVKLIADAETNKLLGAHIIGPHASELIAEIVLAMEFGSPVDDIALTIHAHPTLSESVREASLGLSTGVIHL